MSIICNVCKREWENHDLQCAKWAGILFRYSESRKQLICPDCFDEMRAAFTGEPEKFREWISENYSTK